MDKGSKQKLWSHLCKGPTAFPCCVPEAFSMGSPQGSQGVLRWPLWELYPYRFPGAMLSIREAWKISLSLLNGCGYAMGTLSLQNRNRVASNLLPSQAHPETGGERRLGLERGFFLNGCHAGGCSVSWGLPPHQSQHSGWQDEPLVPSARWLGEHQHMYKWTGCSALQFQGPEWTRPVKPGVRVRLSAVHQCCGL